MHSSCNAGAKGLVHKAVALSGNSISMTNKKNAEELGEYILKEASLDPSEIDKLQQMPWKEYFDITNKALIKYLADKSMTTGGLRMGFSPVADDVDIPSGTFYTSGRNDVPDVPMLICSTFHEFNGGKERPGDDTLTKKNIIDQMVLDFGDSSEAVYNGYFEFMPDSKPADILAAIKTNGVRQSVINTANAKLHQSSPVYTAWFGWTSNLFNGRHRAFHCIDICFWFCNTDVMITHTGGGKVPRALSEKMSDALEAFMRTGNPNAGKRNGLPEWPEYSEEEGAVMILDDESRVGYDPDREFRKMMPARYQRFL